MERLTPKRAMAPCQQRPIFVIGCVRSGTTLLRAMLNAHPNIAIPYEAHTFSRIISTKAPWSHRWSRAEVMVPIEEFLGHPAVQFWKLEQNRVVAELAPAASYGYREIVQAVYSAYAKREGKVRWGDKTPGNVFEMRPVSRAFPDAQFVHITRDGRDVYLSLQTVIRSGESWAVPWNTARAAAKKWAWRERCAYQTGERLGPERYHRLRYEALAQDPATVLREVCRFLEETFDERMLEYYKTEGLVPAHGATRKHRLLSRPPEPSRISRWKREMAPADVQVFERLAGPTLVKYGYDVSPPMRRRARARLATQAVKQRVKNLLAAGHKEPACQP